MSKPGRVYNGINMTTTSTILILKSINIFHNIKLNHSINYSSNTHKNSAPLMNNKIRYLIVTKSSRDEQLTRGG